MKKKAKKRSIVVRVEGSRRLKRLEVLEAQLLKQEQKVRLHRLSLGLPAYPRSSETDG